MFSSLVITSGFCVLLLSSFRLNREFGLLSGIIMMAALLANLFLTPYLTRTLRLLR